VIRVSKVLQEGACTSFGVDTCSSLEKNPATIPLQRVGYRAPDRSAITNSSRMSARRKGCVRRETSRAPCRPRAGTVGDIAEKAKHGSHGWNSLQYHPAILRLHGVDGKGELGVFSTLLVHVFLTGAASHRGGTSLELRPHDISAIPIFGRR